LAIDSDPKPVSGTFQALHHKDGDKKNRIGREGEGGSGQVIALPSADSCPVFFAFDQGFGFRGKADGQISNSGQNALTGTLTIEDKAQVYVIAAKSLGGCPVGPSSLFQSDFGFSSR